MAESVALSAEEIETALGNLPGWSFDGTHIRKEYVFKGFRGAMAFIMRIAFEAEAADHHPDLENHYNKVVIALRSWDSDGVTDRDVALATKIEKISVAFL